MLSFEGIAQAVKNVSAVPLTELAGDEDFWASIRKGYRLKPDSRRQLQIQKTVIRRGEHRTKPIKDFGGGGRRDARLPITCNCIGSHACVSLHHLPVGVPGDPHPHGDPLAHVGFEPADRFHVGSSGPPITSDSSVGACSSSSPASAVASAPAIGPVR